MTILASLRQGQDLPSRALFTGYDTAVGHTRPSTRLRTGLRSRGPLVLPTRLPGHGAASRSRPRFASRPAIERGSSDCSAIVPLPSSPVSAWLGQVSGWSTHSPNQGRSGKRRAPSHAWSSSTGWRSWYRPRADIAIGITGRRRPIDGDRCPRKGLHLCVQLPGQGQPE
jgi:hypothetical protein